MKAFSALAAFLSTHPWVTLVVAIVCEVMATSALKAADGFRHLVPTVLVVVGYSVSFYCLSLTLRHLPLGVAYAVWSGVGAVLVLGVGVVVYHQKPDMAALVGVGLIVAGVLVLNLWSNPHG
jgi:small multidrug resistance pump